jgi:hypothetical protein
MNTFGPESAAVTRAKQEAQLKQTLATQGITLDTPQGYMAAAKVARDMNMPELSAKFSLAGAQLDKEISTSEKNRRIDADKMADMAIYNKYLEQFGGDQAKAGAAFNEYKQQQAIQQRIAGRTIVNVNNQQETEFVKELGKLQGKQMENAYNTRNAAVETLGTLSKMSELNDKDLISGAFSGPRATTANFFNTIGLASKGDAKTLANTQQFEKVAGDLVLANVKKLGYNPSNADVIFINKLIPQLESSPEARKALINWMGTKAQASIKEVANMEAYAVKNKSLNGYAPTIPNFTITGSSATPSTVTATKPLSEMTVEELRALKAKAQANK